MEKDLGYRKIQSTGRGSYIISLPKEWVQSIGIEKGNEIAFKLQEDFSLLLTPSKIIEEKVSRSKPEIKECWIYVHEKDDPKTICRKIISLYVINADLIHVRFANNKAIEHKIAIKNLVKTILLGAEIIDESQNIITIQILINHPEFPIEKAIRRMIILALLANKTAVSMLIEKDEDTNKINEYKSDVARLNLYVLRQLKFGLERVRFTELGFKSPKEFLGYRIIINDIKSIADNAAIITHNIDNLRKMIRDQQLFIKEKIDEEVYAQILEINSKAHQLFEESISAMFKRDYEHADKIIFETESLSKQERNLMLTILSKKLDPMVSSIFSLILDNSRRIIEYAIDISEVTLNRTIEEVVERNTLPHNKEKNNQSLYH
ncbi:MAG: phosphate uptake regulator PhoU [Candidatus Jordarchaeaceae archaeon]